MASIETLRNNIITKLQSVNDLKRLEKVNRVLDEEHVEDVYQFTEAQLKMLELSEEDIKNGRVISNEELHKQTMKWLNEE